MKKRNVLLLSGLLTLALAVPVFADDISRPIDIFSDLSGVSVEEAWSLRHDSDLTFGELAKEKGVYDDFKSKMQALNEERIEGLLEDEKITEDQAEAMLDQMENCDGVPGTGVGINMKQYGGSGNGLRQGNGQGQGRGLGFGSGSGNENGQGLGMNK